jgi:hypothetical protein
MSTTLNTYNYLYADTFWGRGQVETGAPIYTAECARSLSTENIMQRSCFVQRADFVKQHGSKVNFILQDTYVAVLTQWCSDNGTEEISWQTVRLEALTDQIILYLYAIYVYIG